jgi:hypothetical protein
MKAPPFFVFPSSFLFLLILSMKVNASIERVEHLVRAIPLMSKTIVDDTLYEKVLTILVGFLDSHPTHAQYLTDWQSLAILQQASARKGVMEE